MSFANFHWAGREASLGIVREALLSLVSTRMSRVAFHLDYFAYPPVIVLCLAVGLTISSVLLVTATFAAGLAAWTLAEYLLHRFALHHWPYISKFHQAHHDEPRAKIGAPTLFTLLFFFGVAFVPIWALVNAIIASAFFAGFLMGYIAFAAVHEAVHHSQSQNLLMRYFKKLHAIHHHGDSSKNFGVITSFWDHVFGTYAGTIKRSTQS
jgi:sterol desaturase/sphingolipid hydroxylase (fatty acid hydroxylase superfamily)